VRQPCGGPVWVGISAAQEGAFGKVHWLRHCGSGARRSDFRPARMHRCWQHCWPHPGARAPLRAQARARRGRRATRARACSSWSAAGPSSCRCPSRSWTASSRCWTCSRACSRAWRHAPPPQTGTRLHGGSDHGSGPAHARRLRHGRTCPERAQRCVCSLWPRASRSSALVRSALVRGAQAHRHSALLGKPLC